MQLNCGFSSRISTSTWHPSASKCSWPRWTAITTALSVAYFSCSVLGALHCPADMSLVVALRCWYDIDMILVPYSILAYLLNQASAYLVALVEGLGFICAEFDEFVTAMTAYMQTTADDVSYIIKFAVNAHKKVSIALLIVILLTVWLNACSLSF